jgi:cold shock CspA family protein
MTVETNDVRDAFSHLSTAETETSEQLAEGVRVTVHESEAGPFFREVRENGFDANTTRLGDALVSHIEAEESDGLGSLFG